MGVMTITIPILTPPPPQPYHHNHISTYTYDKSLQFFIENLGHTVSKLQDQKRIRTGPEKELICLVSVIS